MYIYYGSTTSFIPFLDNHQGVI